MLRVTDINVVLGKTQILHSVSFSARPREVTAIVGPNGSGKTTLLRAMTGDVAYRGRVTLNDRDPASLHPWELADLRGVLPQASSLAFPFTVLEVVQIGLYRSGLGDQEAIPMQALARVGLDVYAHRFYQELSGGEQQRVQLARVLSQVWEPLRDGEPRWLFLDEPVSALDIAYQLEVMEITRDFAQAGGGVVAVMHDLNLTAMFADQITILNAGNVLMSGAPAEVMTDVTMSQAYGCSLLVGRTPPPGTPFILPQTASRALQ